MALTAGKTRGKVEDVHLAQIDSRKGGVGGDGTGKMTAGKTRGRVVLVGTGRGRRRQGRLGEGWCSWGRDGKDDGRED